MNGSILGLILIFALGASCAPTSEDAFADLSPLASTSWPLAVQYQCLTAVKAAGGDQLACNKLINCVEARAKGTPLEDRAMRPLYRRIVAYEPLANRPLTMSAARARANGLGPDGIALFAAMEQSRLSCLQEAGLSHYLGDD